MKNIVVLIIITLTLLLAVSCKKETASTFIDSPIINAYLETGNPFALNVSRQITYYEDAEYSDDDIDNLKVYLNFNGSDILLNATGDGNYSDSNVIIAEGDEYTVNFSFNDEDVEAYTYIPTKPTNFTQSVTSISIEKTDSASGPPTGTMADPVELNWDNLDNSAYLVVAENMEDDLEAIRDFGDVDPPGNRFKKTPTYSSAELLRTDDFQYYGTHRIILFHVLPDYATLYEENSTSSQNITNPSTSITNGYGIFTGLNSDTLYIEIVEI